MAENLRIKKSVDSVLECPLCLHQLKLPQTLQQCLHSYCKSCLDKVPQETQDDHQGWLCPMCENFTKCDQVQQNTFLEELQKCHNEHENCDEIKCVVCSDNCGPATWKCTDCKIEMCENGKALHLRFPLLKGHNVLPLDSEGEKLIDDIVFCKVHEGIPAQLNCRDCAHLICYKCNITDHEHHKAETVEQALEIILPEVESSVRQVNENISIIEAQIEGINKEIEQSRESYASCRMQMDDHLEKVICQIRAMKAQREEDVNEQESIALDTLKKLKQQLESLKSQARILSNLTAVVTTKTRHTSQLQQLQNGLFEKVKSASASKKADFHFQLPEAKFIIGHRIKEELDNIFGGLRFSLKENNISTSGESWTDKDDSLCHNLEEIADLNFTKCLEIDIEGKWCNRLSHIDNKLWLSPANDSVIKLYNEDGKLENTFYTGEKNITIMKEVYNGDLICGTGNGLYKTNKDFKEWAKVTEGRFSDVVVDQRRFFALECASKYIHEYCLTANGEYLNIHKHSLDTGGLKDLVLDHNCTLGFCGEYFWVTSSKSKKLYKFSNRGKYLQMWKKENVDPVFCGIDQKGKALIADNCGGEFYLLDTKQNHEISMKEICKSIKSRHICDAVFDSNDDLWTVSVDTAIKLTKYSQNRHNDT